MKHSLFIVACINIIIFGPATLPTSIAVQEIEEIESISQEEPRLDFIKDNDNTNNQLVNRHELTKQSSEKLELNSHEPHIEDFDKERLNEIESDKGEEYYKDDINEQDLVKQEQNSLSGENVVEKEEEQTGQLDKDRIELISFHILEEMVQEVQYLAVYFFKHNCKVCEEILESLERIDDECDVFGILLVKIQDPKLAKRYSIKTFPALIFFRNGNPLLFEGDLQDEDAVLAWLVKDDNRELANEIDEVNERILERMIKNSLLLVVLFFNENCPVSEKVLEELERIDDEVDQYGIDMVKISDSEAAAKYNIRHIPTLVYFRKRSPLVYTGDLLDEEKLLVWLTSQNVFELKNEILGVNSYMLEKILSENEFLAVYFYNEDYEEDMGIMARLEKIDDDMEDINVTIVKMGDPNYARKWGVIKLPSIVYFCNRYPNVYRGGFENELDVLKWLQKNRNTHPKLNLIIYTLMVIMFGLVTYMAPSLILSFQQPPDDTE